MITRRTALKGAVAAAAITTQSTHDAAAKVEESSAIGEAAFPRGAQLYGPDHPLAQGEVVRIPDPEAPDTILMEVEEISCRVSPPESRAFLDDEFTAEDLLHVRIEEEAHRFIAPEWIAYKHQLRNVRKLLTNAGVSDDTVDRVIDDLDCVAVDLCATAGFQMLNLGAEAGRKMAMTWRSSIMFLPGDPTCPVCSGEGKDCATCEGTGLVEPGPQRMLIYVPDALIKAEHAAAAG